MQIINPNNSSLLPWALQKKGKYQLFFFAFSAGPHWVLQSISNTGIFIYSAYCMWTPTDFHKVMSINNAFEKIQLQN